MKKFGKKSVIFLLAFCLLGGSVMVPALSVFAALPPVGIGAPAPPVGIGQLPAGSPTAAPTGGGWQIAIDPVHSGLETATFSARIAALVSELGILGEMLKVVSNIYMMLKEYFGEINEKAENAAHLLVETKKTEAAIATAIGDAAIDGDTSNARLGPVLDLVGEYVTPKHEYLCKKVLLHQLAGTTEDFERAVSRLALKSIESMYRGPTDDGSGPMYAFDEEKLRCEAKFANIIDGYDTSCVDDAKVGPNKRSFADADLSQFTMDGTIALEIPEMTSTAIVLPDGTATSVSVPNPTNDNQRMWLAGLYYCYQMAGPRPTPAGGANMLKPSGKTERARFDHALAMQSAALKPCADLLAYYTKPNRTATALITEQKKLCSAAEGVIDPVDMEKKFGNCENGLSPYQAELLRQMECKSSHSFLANLQAGSTHWQGTDDTIICSTSWNNWAAKVAAKQGAVVDSVRAIQESKGNWAGIGRAKTGAVEEDELEAPRRVVKETRPMPEQKSTRVIKASRSSPAPQLPPKASPKQGLPFAADEIAWPAAVSQ